jgi:hypothetical protein
MSITSEREDNLSKALCQALFQNYFSARIRAIAARALAAFFRLAARFAALVDLPPFRPPNLPSSTAAGFFRWLIYRPSALASGFVRGGSEIHSQFLLFPATIALKWLREILYLAANSRFSCDRYSFHR